MPNLLNWSVPNFQKCCFFLDSISLCLQMYSVHFRWSIMSVESASVSREQDEGCHKSQSLLQPQSNSVSGLSTEHGENSKSLKKVHFGQKSDVLFKMAF